MIIYERGIYYLVIDIENILFIIFLSKPLKNYIFSKISLFLNHINSSFKLNDKYLNESQSSYSRFLLYIVLKYNNIFDFNISGNFNYFIFIVTSLIYLKCFFFLIFNLF